MRIRNSRGVAVVLLAGAVGAVALAGTAGATTAARGQGRLQDLVNAEQATGPVGVVAEATDGGRHTYAAAGLADTATGTPASAVDEFRVGSATKTFVATVALQLVGEGRLSLDDTVAKWLPGLISGNGNDGGEITVRELLQHTSGLYDYTDDFPELDSLANFEADRFDTYTDAQLVAIAMRHAPNFAPGTGWNYSNTEYTVVGMIIRAVTGQSWQQEVEQRIIRPLGLRQTFAPNTFPYLPGPHLDGYSGFGSSTTIDVTALNPSAAGAAGAMISTTGDLTRFYQALIGGRLLPPAQLAEMETTVPAPGLTDEWPGARYGLGLIYIPLSCGGGYWGHGGDIPGYSTRDGISMDGRRVAVADRTGDATQVATVTMMDTLVDQMLCAR